MGASGRLPDTRWEPAWPARRTRRAATTSRVRRGGVVTRMMPVTQTRIHTPAIIETNPSSLLTPCRPETEPAAGDEPLARSQSVDVTPRKRGQSMSTVVEGRNRTCAAVRNARNARCPSQRVVRSAAARRPVRSRCGRSNSEGRIRVGGDAEHRGRRLPPPRTALRSARADRAATRQRGTEPGSTPTWASRAPADQMIRSVRRPHGRSRPRD